MLLTYGVLVTVEGVARLLSLPIVMLIGAAGLSCTSSEIKGMNENACMYKKEPRIDYLVPFMI